MNTGKIASDKYTIAVDFDETLCEKNYPNGKWACCVFGPPITGAAKAMRELRQLYKVLVFTARSEYEKKAVEAHLDQHGIVYDEVICEKPVYVALVDDKSVRFEGDWEKTMAELHTKVIHGKAKKMAYPDATEFRIMEHRDGETRQVGTERSKRAAAFHVDELLEEDGALAWWVPVRLEQ